VSRNDKRRTTLRGEEPGLDLDAGATVEVLEEFLRVEVTRTGRRAVVVGLSGGIDSAVACALAVRSLGPDAVHALLLPHRNSDPSSLRHAELMVGRFGMAAEKVDITPMVDGFLEAVGPVDPLRLGNVMARCRMIVLYDRSAVHDALVLGTSNKSELLLGYGTLHGDLASALNPLGDLYKTQIRALGAWLRIPSPILKKRPSADLWPGQSDEEDLGFSYEDVDRILCLRIDARMSRGAVIEAGYAEELVDRVDALVVRSQFKRRLPLIAKVSTRSVGWDFRYPRDWRT
jgi:NAD+ synthase